jgi:hypothetical protein
MVMVEPPEGGALQALQPGDIQIVETHRLAVAAVTPVVALVQAVMLRLAVIYKAEQVVLVQATMAVEVEPDIMAAVEAELQAVIEWAAAAAVHPGIILS